MQQQQYSDQIIHKYLDEQRSTKSSIDLMELVKLFNSTERSIRESLIRLFFQGKFYGYIKDGILYFDDNASSLGLDEVIDWNINEFNLAELLKEAQLQIQSNRELQNENNISDYVKDDISFYEKEANPQKFKLLRVKEISQKENMAVEMRVGLYGIAYALHIKIHNNSNHKIFNVRSKLKLYNISNVIFPNDPSGIINKEDDLIEAIVKKEEMEANSIWELIIVFSLNNSAITEFSIKCLILFQNAEHKARVMKLEDLKHEIIIPSLDFNQIHPSQIQSFIKTPVYSKVLLAFKIPNDFKPANIQAIMESIIQQWNFFPISKIERENIQMTFFSAKGIDSNNIPFEMILVPQVKGPLIELYGVSPYEGVLITLLHAICQQLPNELIKGGFIQNKSELIPLNCIKCGAILSVNIQPNEIVMCKFCKTDQIPWLRKQ